MPSGVVVVVVVDSRPGDCKDGFTVDDRRVGVVGFDVLVGEMDRERSAITF